MNNENFNMDESDDQISYNDVSDFEYSPETEHETTDIDEDYIAVSDNSVSDEYLSEDSLDRRHKRKKAAPKSNFKIFKRPALKLKNRREKSSSSDSSTVSSDTWEDDDIKDSDQVDSDDGHKRKIIDEELFPIIERILKTRVAAIGDIGPATSIYMGLTNQYSKSSLIPSENEEQYLIKWKNQSYLHCTWENIISLKKNGIKGFKKLENYIKKKEASEGIYLDEPDMFTSFDEPIDDYTTLERIISSRSNNLNVTEYLCKWKSLQYEDCTWESFDLVSTLFSSLIEEFLDRPNHFINKFEMKSLSNISYCKEKLFKNLDTIHSNTDGSVGLKLRDYQAEGVKWLIHSCFIGNSVILADEMGLGKTVQIIKYIHYLLSEFNLGGPHLIIVPLSTLDTWIKHFRVWASIIHVVSFVGNAKSRQFIRDYELNQDEKLKFNVLITTYEWVFKESALLSTYNWFSMIIDEGHRIKNDNSMLYQSLYNFPSYHRILMTGTPLQNSLRELWSLLHFIMPHKFNEPDVIEKYGEYQDKQQGYEELKSHISEFILRRTKKDVEKSLPPKIEQILRVNMTNMQKKYYKWILSKNYAELSRDTKGSISGFLNIIMELKKCCNHADLVIPEHQKFHTDDISNILVGSGKLILLDKLLCRLHETNSRVLIFSQMVMMLDILSTYLMKRKFNFQRLDGSMNEASRIRAIDHFNSPGSSDFCFLLSTKAGGLGINLVTADTVIIYDSDWNPQNDLQAQARAHRIGQKKQVKIYRLVTKSSIEENIVERAKQKMVLDHLVIQTMDNRFSSGFLTSNSNSVMFNKEELTLILKFGAEELFKENIEEDGKEPLQELDLDDIMKLSEPTDTDGLHQLSRGEEFLSSFKVANFKSLEIDENLYKDSIRWKDIIPQSEVLKINNENFVKKQAELYLPPRRTIKQVSEKQANTLIDSLDENSADDDEKNKLTIDSLNKRSLRQFIREYQKFSYASTRLELVLKSAEVTNTESNKEDCIAISEFIESSILDIKRNHGSVKINNIKINLNEFIQDRKITSVVGDTLQLFINENPSLKMEQIKVKFTLSLRRPPKATWNSRWTKIDDARLIVGVYYHGIQNWKHISNDKNLNLSTKLKNKKGSIASSVILMEHLSRLTKLLDKNGNISSKCSKTVVSSEKHSKSSARTKDKEIPDPILNSEIVQKSRVSNIDSFNNKSLNEKNMAKCVETLKSVKKNLSNLEGITVKDLPKHREDVKKVGAIIYSAKTKTLNLSSDVIWNFVARFTSVSHKELESFYNKNCIAK